MGDLINPGTQAADHSFLDDLRRWSQKKLVTRLLTVVRSLFLLAIASYLIGQLADIGWTEVWQARPRDWLFYALFVAMFLTVPASEAVIYGLLWNTSMWRQLPVFLRKRVYNNIVLDYSGEAYLCIWAKQNLGLSDREVLTTVKDNNVLSAIVGASVTVIVLAGFALTGQIVIADEYGENLALYGAVAAFGAALLVPAAIAFRRHIISLSRREVLKVLLIHCLRFVAVQSFRVAQWAVVLPEVPLSAWLTFLAVNIVILRLPFVPAKGFIFIGLGISLSDAVGVPSAAFASLLLVNAALHYGFHLVAFVVTSFGRVTDRRDGISDGV